MLAVCLFGEIEVRTADGRLLGPGDFGGVKPREIFEILVLRRGRVLSKETLADLLWRGAPPDDAVATLESYVSMLRKRLAPGVPAKASPIGTTNGGYRLDLAQVTVDLDEVDAMLRLAEQLAPADALALIRAALQLARGPVLEHAPDAGWAASTRRGWSDRIATAAVRAAGTALDLGDHDRALSLARRALRADALAEDAWRLVMRAHMAAGRRAEALRAYQSCRTRLAEALGVDPSPQTRQLFGLLLQADPAGLSADQARAELDRAVAAVIHLVQQAHTPHRDRGQPVTPTQHAALILDLLRRTGVAVALGAGADSSTGTSAEVPAAH